MDGWIESLLSFYTYFYSVLVCRAFITWLANGDTIRIFKMTKKDDGSFTFKAAPEDFPQKHKANVINIGIAETGMMAKCIQAE